MLVFVLLSWFIYVRLTHDTSEYDFFNFNTIGGKVTVNTLVSPTLNAYDPSRPVAVAVSIDSLEPQTTYFIPPAVPGSLPPQWDGTDGFVVCRISYYRMRRL